MVTETKPITYKFGVMSNIFTLQSDNEDIAKVAMSLHMQTSAPIAIYEPKSLAFNPTQVLEDYLPQMEIEENKNKLLIVLKTISTFKNGN